MKQGSEARLGTPGEMLTVTGGGGLPYTYPREPSKQTCNCTHYYLQLYSKESRLFSTFCHFSLGMQGQVFEFHFVFFCWNVLVVYNLL